MCSKGGCDQCRYWQNLKDIGKNEDDFRLAMKAQHELDQLEAKGDK